jgi:hypothetical protein
MYIFFKGLIYFFLIVFCLLGCSVLNVVKNNVRDYSGDIEIVDNESLYLRFTLKIDENKNIRIRLFENFGIKVAEFIVKRDSIIIKSIIFDEYKKYIEGFFFKYNNALCINYLVSDIFELTIFNKLDIPVCYVKENDNEVSNDDIKIFTLEQNFVMSINRNKILAKHKNSIYLKFDNNKYCVINFIEMKNQ